MNNKQKKAKFTVLFCPSTGQGLGVGNIVRCYTISEYLDNDIKSIFYIQGKTPDLNLLLQKQINVITGTDQEKIILKCNLIVYDHQGPIRATSTFENFKKLAPDAQIIAMDYFYRDEHLIDSIINLSDYFETDWPERAPNCAYFEGLDYAVIRPSFLPFRPKTIPKTESVKKVLITFGGEDPSCWSQKVLLWLEQYVKEELMVKIIMGPFNRSLMKIQNALQSDKKRHSYELLDYLPDMERYMSESDIVFCGGGTTIMEAAFLGKPVVALPQHDMERFFLKYFEKAGYLLPDLEESVTSLKESPISNLFTSSALRCELAKQGMKLVDGKGARRIAQIISNQLLNKTRHNKEKIH